MFAGASSAQRVVQAATEVGALSADVSAQVAKTIDAAASVIDDVDSLGSAVEIIGGGLDEALHTLRIADDRLIVLEAAALRERGGRFEMVDFPWGPS